jgi:cytoskeletal protein CcmA (bactofilin family)
MTVRISQLPNLEVGELITLSSIVPLVADSETHSTSMANIKTYMETGDFNVTGNITAQNAIISGNLSVDVLTANTQIVANTTTVTSTSNFLDIQTDGNLTLPISDNGFDVGTRMFYYKTAGDVAALVWKNSTGTATVGTMELGQLLATNTTAATSTTTGALIVSGGAGVAGNLHVGTQAVITGNTSGSNLSLTGLATVTGNITAQGTISTPGRTTTGNLGVNTFVTVGSTLTTVGNITTAALWVNGAATVGTNISVTSNVNSSSITVSDRQTIANTLTVGKTFTASGGIQNTPIGNATAGTGRFTTLITTSTTSLGGLTTVTGNVNPSADVTYYLGNNTNRWETIFANTITANATTALYADLAEKYIPDQYYDPGTVVIFGGAQEITVTDQQGDTRVAGAISTEPAYLMNNGEENGVPVALRGKIPVKVVGSVNKGDLLITSNVAGYATAAKFYKPDPHAVFAKSLVRDDSDGPRVIWAVIL